MRSNPDCMCGASAPGALRRGGGWAILSATALLAACGDDAPAPPNDAVSIDVPDTIDASPAPSASATTVPSPAPSAEAAPGTARAASDLVRRYLDHLGRGEAGAATALWIGDPAASDAFARALAEVQPVSTEVGVPGAIAASGDARAVTVPVRVTLAEDDHRFARLVLAQAGGAGGPWRIRSAELLDERDAQDGDVPEAMPATISVRYFCDDDSELFAAFDNRAGTVAVYRDGDRLAVLRQQVAGSGIAYAGEGFALRGKGDDATITGPGIGEVDCSVD